ncbi:MAG: hypothetical protein QOE35_3096 [Actinomycetota bacterium]|jgi:hypothetical protein
MRQLLTLRRRRVVLGLLVAGAVAATAAGRAAEREGDSPVSEAVHLEQAGELMRVFGTLEQRFGEGQVGDYRAAIAQRAALAQVAAPGAAGTWSPVGTGPLIADDPTYPTAGEGYSRLAGRISDFAYDAATHRLFAAVASGGLWASDDMGGHWRPIGDGLPTQQVGSVGYSPAGGGTLIALTGDNAFGGYTYGGAGVYHSEDEGATWHKAAGVPDGAMGFKVAVDPTDPSVVYAATGVGLFRSTDTGRSFANVDLPTGACHGNSFAPGCFLANVVTDVVVQAPDTFGHTGGTVLAAVGWRAGAFKNADGSVQAPGNGLYRSDSGVPGSFGALDVDGNGFAPQANIGRVELGAAVGPDQDHGYVYAEVQDAVLFTTGKIEGLDTPSADPFGIGIDPTNTTTYLNGVYVSADFGQTWTLVADHKQFELPTTGSVLAQLSALGFGPGIQSWYDEWIKPDPTRQDANGVPTRLVLGLEEIYQNRLTALPVNGLTDFQAIGPYDNGAHCLIIAAQPACDAQHQVAPATTTHPDQHAGIWIPDGQGGVALVVGNDGGAYVQAVGAGQELTTAGFGKGAQEGFHTLLPYGVTMAKDGTIYAGLQDNGEMKIPVDGSQHMAYGGDGVFTVVDPNDSNVVYEETPEAGIAGSTDGGMNWTSMAPFFDSANFYSPLVMDPSDARHLFTGGSEIAETTFGPDTNAASDGSKDWAIVFDLGTQQHPADVNATADEPADPNNIASAQAVLGDAAYAAFCGGCDPVRDHHTFGAGIATNVGGSKPPMRMTSDGWHIAKATGLPKRLITSVTIDPHDTRTIYVTLGSSHIRPYAPPGAVGPDGLDPTGGHVYKSTDAGETFFDISGDLPAIGAGWSVLHDQLVVGTTVGVFTSVEPAASAAPGHPLHFAVLGDGLPAVPVFSMQLSPSDPNVLVVATLGRGIYRYAFSASAAAAPPPAPVAGAGTLAATGPPSGTAALGALVFALALAAIACRRRVSAPSR